MQPDNALHNAHGLSAVHNIVHGIKMICLALDVLTHLFVLNINVLYIVY